MNTILDFFGAIFIIVIGSFFHFLYDLTNHNKIVGYFTAVNESTWEHMKLIIAPTFLWFILEYHFYYNNPSLFFSKFIGLLVMLIIIPIIYYSYTSILKKNILIIDIASFILSASIGQLVFNRLLKSNCSSYLYIHIGIIGLLIIFLIYITSTYVPIKNIIYKDPITKKYGVNGHAKD